MRAIALHDKRLRQNGQSLLIVGLMMVVLVGIAGLAVDGAVAYGYSVALERAASAGALAGVPYLPDKCTAPAGANNNATERAIAEVAKNGYTITAADVQCDTTDRILVVTARATVPTFFMEALGVGAFPVVRTAKAGFRPPISLGQPGSKIGSTVSELGAGGAFYFARQKGWNAERSEGDAFTPNPTESGGNTSADMHSYSPLQGNEVPALSPADCTSGTAINVTNAGIKALPCRGGYNYRIVIPETMPQAEIDVYNMAFAPDFNRGNTCENSKNLPTCNGSGYHYHEDDFGGFHCGPGAGSNCDTGSPNTRTHYNAAAYTLLKVNDIFIRNTDTVLSQKIVLPVDATNFDGNQGGTGPGSNTTPTYTNVNTNGTITQSYVGGAAAGTGASPSNMKIYHSWADVANYTGPNDSGLVVHKDAAAHPGGTTLGPGTYRLRVDSLNYDGSFTPNRSGMTGNGSKGFAVRAVVPGTGACAANCVVAGWQDMCVYTPVNGTGQIPLFELPNDYRGATVDVDVFDLGDAAAPVTLSLINPDGGLVYDTTKYFSSGAPTVPATNLGMSRLATPPGIPHTGNQTPAPKPLGAADRGSFTNTQAGVQTASVAYGSEYQGSWIRITIDVPSAYNSTPGTFWQLKYQDGGLSFDTFTFTVTARGGPVHLISS
jgi:Flp pilus assembly protein TadG